MNLDVIKKIHEEVSSRANNNSRSCVQDQIEILYSHREFWAYREIKSVGYREFKSFLDYSEAAPPWGLGWPEQMVKAFLTPEKASLYLTMQGEKRPLYQNGGDRSKGSSGTCTTENRGNSSTYKIQRLKRDAPEYAEKVIRGELSANQAMVQAGLRLEKVTIPVDVNAFCNAIKRKFSPLEIQQLKELL